MKLNLTLIRDAIEGADNDAQKSLYFYNTPKARIAFIMDVLGYSIHQLDNPGTPDNFRLRQTEILTFLDNNYHQFAWPAHEVHFHTDFLQYASCPFTCLNEISTMLDKLVKERFAS